MKDFFSLLYIKCLMLLKKTLENNGIEVIIDSVNALWRNETNIDKIGHRNLPAITNKFDKIYKKSRYALLNKPIKQLNRKFLHINLALKIVMDKSWSFLKKLGFKLYDVINTKEQTIINSIKDMLEGENIQT